MSGGLVCRCRYGKGRQRFRHWRVVQWMENRSAFNGYRATPSDYSEVECTQCRARWRTKARYVNSLAQYQGSEA